jgi:hypothetical protein
MPDQRRISGTDAAAIITATIAKDRALIGMLLRSMDDEDLRDTVESLAGMVALQVLELAEQLGRDPADVWRDALSAQPPSGV